MEKFPEKEKHERNRSQVILGVLIGILFIIVFISFGYLVEIVMGNE